MTRYIQPLNEPLRQPRGQITPDARESYFEIHPVHSDVTPGNQPAILSYNLLCNIGVLEQGPFKAKIGSWDDIGRARAMLKFFSRRLDETVNALRSMYWHGDPDAFLALHEKAEELVKLPETRRVVIHAGFTFETDLDDIDTIANLRRNGLVVEPRSIYFLNIAAGDRDDPTTQPTSNRTE